MAVNSNSRLEAFCDGVFAIALTLLIIDVKIHSPESIASTPQLWNAIQHLAPSLFAFALSFAIIFITWVNHHATLKLVHKSSASFIYANGFLLLAVVLLPFTTSLLGEFLLTDYPAPAVVIYDAVLAGLAFGWILLTNTALTNQLVTTEGGTVTMGESRRNAYFAVALYAVLSILAVWFPRTVAVVTTVTWIFWLVLGIRMKHA